MYAAVSNSTDSEGRFEYAYVTAEGDHCITEPGVVEFPNEEVLPPQGHPAVAILGNFLAFKSPTGQCVVLGPELLEGTDLGQEMVSSGYYLSSISFLSKRHHSE